MTAKDFVAAFVTPIGIVAKLLSFALLIFAGPLSDQLALGVGFSLIGAAAATMVFAVASDLPFAIAVPESKSVAVLVSLAGVVSAQVFAHGRPDELGPTVLAALLCAALVVGVASYLLGVLKLGRLIRFTPYPIIGGFMAASGWILATGGVRVLLREPLTLKTLAHVSNPDAMGKLAAGVVLAIALRSIRRVEHPLAFPALLAIATLAIHLGLTQAGLSPEAARESGWLLSFPSAADLPIPWLFASAAKINFDAILSASGEYAAVVAVTLATLLLSLMAIEVGARREIDLDYELKVNGIANALAGVSGGMVGAISANRTLFHYKMGARARASAALAGLLCLAPIAVGPSALGFVPVPVLGALLLQLGAELLEEWLVRGLKSHAEGRICATHLDLSRDRFLRLRCGRRARRRPRLSDFRDQHQPGRSRPRGYESQHLFQPGREADHTG